LGKDENKVKMISGHQYNWWPVAEYIKTGEGSFL
jgi:hypothetical protein